MVFETNKQKGNSGLVTAIAYYGLKGYVISIPLNDTQDYDLIVDNGKKLLKVQVKATGQRTPQGYTQVSVASTGGTFGDVYKTVKNTDIDILFVVTELQELYEIPIEEVTTVKSLNLGPDRQKFRVDNVNTEYVLKTSASKEKEKEKELKYCTKCGVLVSDRNTSGLCHACAEEEKRVVKERPSKEQLLQELKNSNFVAVGRKYGVTDNAIRKWCVNYGLPTHIKEIRELV